MLVMAATVVILILVRGRRRRRVRLPGDARGLALGCDRHGTASHAGAVRLCRDHLRKRRRARIDGNRRRTRGWVEGWGRPGGGGRRFVAGGAVERENHGHPAHRPRTEGQGYKTHAER